MATRSVVPTMATSFGKLKEFDLTSGEDWTQYIERMEFYFIANGVTDAGKQRAAQLVHRLTRS